jgi:hypothetical protein
MSTQGVRLPNLRQVHLIPCELADGNPFDAYLPPSDPLTDPSTS